MSKVSVAIFGINGTVGAPLIKAIQSETFAGKFQFPILAVTRDVSKVTSTDKVKYVEGDYANATALAEKLKGTDVIVELVKPDPQIIANVEKVVALVKPKLFVPSQFGVALPDAQKIFPGILALKTEHSKNVRALGIKVVDVYTSFFAEGAWLYEIIGHVGADLESKTVTYFSSPDVPFTYSSLTDIGRSVASLITKPVGELPDEVRIESGKITAGQVVQRYEETHDVKFTVKEVVPREEVLKRAKEEWAANGFQPAKFLYYLQVVSSLGEGYGTLFSKNDRELVNPGESLWTWAKY